MSDDSTQSSRLTVPPGVVDILGEFYAFLTKASRALEFGSLRDINSPDQQVRSLIDRVEPSEPVFPTIRIPYILKRELETSRPGRWIVRRMQSGIFSARNPRFAAGLLEHLRLPFDFTRSVSLYAVLSQYGSDDLRTFKDLLDLEIDALKRSYFSDDAFKHWQISNVAFSLGLVATWSAVMAALVGSDMLLSLWTDTAAAAKGSAIAAVAGWAVFAVGVIAILLWSTHRYANKKQGYRLGWIRCCVVLFLESRARNGETGAQ